MRKSKVGSRILPVILAGLVATSLGGIGLAENAIPGGNQNNNVGVIPADPFLNQQVRLILGVSFSEQVALLFQGAERVHKLLEGAVDAIPGVPGGCRVDEYAGYRPLVGAAGNAAREFANSVDRYRESLQRGPHGGSCLAFPGRASFRGSLEALKGLQDALNRVVAYDGTRHDGAHQRVLEARVTVMNVITPLAASIAAVDFGRQYGDDFRRLEERLRTVQDTPEGSEALRRVALMRRMTGELRSPAGDTNSQVDIHNIARLLADGMGGLDNLVARNPVVAGALGPGYRNLSRSIRRYLDAMVDAF